LSSGHDWGKGREDASAARTGEIPALWRERYEDEPDEIGDSEAFFLQALATAPIDWGAFPVSRH